MSWVAVEAVALARSRSACSVSSRPASIWASASKALATRRASMPICRSSSAICAVIACMVGWLASKLAERSARSPCNLAFSSLSRWIAAEEPTSAILSMACPRSSIPRIIAARDSATFLRSCAALSWVDSVESCWSSRLVLLGPVYRSLSTLNCATAVSVSLTLMRRRSISSRSHPEASAVSDSDSCARRVTWALAIALAISAARCGSVDCTRTEISRESRSCATVNRS